MRTLTGVGTPRGLQGRVVAVLTLVVALWIRLIVAGHVKVRNSRQASTGVTAVSVPWCVAVSG